MARILTARNPLTGASDYSFAAPSADEMAADIATLRARQPAWAALPLAERAATLRRFAEAIRERRPAIEAALAADTGRRAIAASEVDGVLASIERWIAVAGEALLPSRRPAQALQNVELISEGDPIPVIGAISPWNFPLLLAFVDALPALIAGCSVYIKPSEVTPRFAVAIAEAIEATQNLSGVLRIRPGDGETGANLVEQVDAVAFTGSVATGRKVATAAAAAFIPAFLELGGKDPALVLESADIDRATTALLRASTVATGQACQSIERIYVAAPIFDAFVGMLKEKAINASLTCDDPANGIIGPLIFSRQAEIIAAQLADAVSKGARIHCGGEIIERGGLWIAPTVVTGVASTMAIMTEETFGPIMPVLPFSDIEEAIRLANDSVYGLSASVFADTEDEALAVARRLEAGGVSINDAGLTSFVFEAEKSAYKLSGMGPSRMGPNGLSRFLRRKAYYVNRGAVMPLSAFGERG
ncbi:MAG: aldehyde dehydrogenase family protein [Alphaproteobacteria bacterium]|nr:aldehyde dehydrogenase family protein [Alphaproteobacteria bacterium]